MRASTSSVAASPSFCPRAQISPTSRPTFSGLLTPTPTSSNRGCLTISSITILPTNPVPQATTRFVSESFTPFTIGGLGVVGHRPRESPDLLSEFLDLRPRRHLLGGVLHGHALHDPHDASVAVTLPTRAMPPIINATATNFPIGVTGDRSP